MTTEQRIDEILATFPAGTEHIRIARTALLQLMDEARIDELMTMLKPVKCYRPWCKQEHTLVKKSYVKDRIAHLTDAAPPIENSKEQDDE